MNTFLRRLAEYEPDDTDEKLTGMLPDTLDELHAELLARQDREDDHAPPNQSGRFRWFGLEEGPPCPRGCNVLTVLAAVRNGRDEWCCPSCGEPAHANAIERQA